MAKKDKSSNKSPETSALPIEETKTNSGSTEATQLQNSKSNSGLKLHKDPNNPPQHKDGIEKKMINKDKPQDKMPEPNACMIEETNIDTLSQSSDSNYDAKAGEDPTDGFIEVKGHKRKNQLRNNNLSKLQHHNTKKQVVCHAFL
jgi:hypothetical protein